LNNKIGRRSKIIADILGEIPELMFNETYGAFYNTIVFKDGVLNSSQYLKIDNDANKALVEKWVSEPNVDLDKRFVYYLLASKG
ncbi:hypothetical protein ACKUER_25075, partial [Escherichia coli]|uniref:hypothetical protein n=1 Tax=Escherichia coli TaxID=562 RepID=UPI00390C4E14